MHHDGHVTIDLPRALALNALEIVCAGAHSMLRVPAPRDTAKHAIEAGLGRSVFIRGPLAYASLEAGVAADDVYEFTCSDEPELHLRDLRDALARHAQGRGLDSFFSFGGILNVVGFSDAAVLDGIRVQRRLRLRIEDKPGVIETATLLIGRADSRWILEGSLADPHVRGNAVGERVVRVRGDGPARGEVREINGDGVVIQSGQQTTTYPLDCYTIVAGSSYIRRHRGPGTLRRLQIASGSLAANGMRNRYAVKDRFASLAGLVDALGGSFQIGPAGEARIVPLWTEIRVQEPTSAA
jgi:hypothetical protein